MPINPSSLSKRILVIGVFLVSLLLLIHALTIRASAALPPSPTLASGEPIIARVYYNNISDINQLQEYDLYEYNNLADKYVLLALDPIDFQHLENRGLEVIVDEEATVALHASLDRDPFQEGYQTVDGIINQMNSIAEMYPGFAELVIYGQSHCHETGGCITPGGDLIPGDDLLAVRITNNNVPGSSTISNKTLITGGTKPVFFLVANIHARELTTTELALHLAKWLLENYEEDADIHWLIDWHEIWIVPTGNPDGRRLVELGVSPEYGSGAPFRQRKNANIDVDLDQDPDCDAWPPQGTWQYGVDLNRNHSYGWGPPGSSDNPCSQTFRGPNPVSEVETQSLQGLVQKLIPDQRGDNPTEAAPLSTQGILLTLHNYSDLILRPWAHSNDPAPNEEGLKAIGDKMASYNGYLSCIADDCLYKANGTTDDWAYGTLGIPSYTYEIGSDSFMPDFDVIADKQWPDNRDAFFYAALIARKPYEIIAGPDIQNLKVNERSEVEARITAELANSHYPGELQIASAAYSVDVPFWSEGANPVLLNPADGVFDSSQESVTGVINFAGLSPGRHIVYIQGKNSAGHTGISRAQFFFVPTSEKFGTSLLPIIFN